MNLVLILIAIAALAASGVPGLLAGRRGLWGQRLATLILVAAAALGLTGTIGWCRGGVPEHLNLAWNLPWGQFAVALDGLSALFLFPVFVIPALGGIYALAYWKQTDHEDGPRTTFFYGLLAAALALVVVAHDGILFLMAWEVMALAAFFLVTAEDHDPAVRQAGWVYLVATHVATLALIALMALWNQASGSFALTPLAAGSVPSGMAAAMFVLALVGFGLKAGIIPLHVWLPGAHSSAPSHVSAVMSGVLIKMGVYGIVRFGALLPAPPAWWGGVVLGIGVVSGLLGVLFAIGQHDLKRLLAYHSIENIGIIMMGVGLALLGRTYGRADWVALGLAGGLLHVWNHGLFKSLLFFGAGSVVHAVHTRQIDQLGGLAKRMPRTAALFIVGAVAICGLPPLNGFVSELLIYLGLFRTLGPAGGAAAPVAALAVPALAMVGALAVACFVKVCGATFLGEPRTEAATHAHEAGPAMVGPMAVLAGLCLLLGVAPLLAVPVLHQASAAWAPELAGALPALPALAPLALLTGLGLMLLLAVAAGFVVLRRAMRRTDYQTVGTWDCGYAAPTARMQYTSASFAQMLVRVFAWVLRPRAHAPHIEGPFPKPARFESHVADSVLETLVVPVFKQVDQFLARFRFLQQGRMQLYLLYILVVLVILLLWL